MLEKETNNRKNNDHIHRLVRITLRTCSDCGRFFITNYTRTKNGELVPTELELDLKVKSLRSVGHQATGGQDSAYPNEPTDHIEVEEETCF